MEPLSRPFGFFLHTHSSSEGRRLCQKKSEHILSSSSELLFQKQLLVVDLLQFLFCLPQLPFPVKENEGNFFKGRTQLFGVFLPLFPTSRIMRCSVEDKDLPLGKRECLKCLLCCFLGRVGYKASVQQLLNLIHDRKPGHSLSKQFLKQRRAILQINIVRF